MMETHESDLSRWAWFLGTFVVLFGSIAAGLAIIEVIR